MQPQENNYRLIFMSEEYKDDVRKIISKHRELKAHNKQHPLLKMINEIGRSGFCRTENFNKQYLIGDRKVLAALENYIIDLNVAITEESEKARMENKGSIETLV